MNTSIYFRKSLALLSLLALVAVPLGALATTYYGTPITINNPASRAYDYFGVSVSVDGNKFIVGAPGVNSNTSFGFVSAYLYDAATGALIQTFNNPATSGNNFGSTVSISGDKVLIGAWGNDIGANNTGSAYLYDATTGALIQTFNNPTPVANDNFGSTVSISGDKVLIGAAYDDTGATDAGSAYLFDAATGALIQTFNNPTPVANGNFGYSVSISNDRVLIGALLDDTGVDYAGSAYLYDATTGALLYTFNNPTPEYRDLFGQSVSISGDKVLIGAKLDDDGATDAGSAYLYDAITGALLHTFNNPTPVANDWFGHSVSISGDKVLISALWDNSSAALGSAYLYDATTGALLQTFNAQARTNRFSESVSISGDKVLIGAPYTGISSVGGSVYLYLPDTDTDGDGIFDSVDNCPADANADQADTDGDGQGNICDFTPNGDTDGDGIDELVDNCPGVANAGQEDNDADGIGNVCDPTPDGDPDPNPTNIDQCKNLGWMDFAFRNQGQCVAFVNTGHDSR